MLCVVFLRLMFSIHQAAGLAVITKHFPPSCSPLPHLTAQGCYQVCLSCSFWPIFNWVSPWSTSRKTTGWCIKKPPDQIKSSVFLLMAMAVTERGWAVHGSRPRVMAGSWSLENQYVFLSSLREPCLSLAITVCHATERRGHTLSLSCVFPSWPWWHSPPSHTQHLKRETCHPSLLTRC